MTRGDWRHDPGASRLPSPPGLPAQPATALVELTGIVSEKGKFYAYITDGRRHWQIVCEETHLRSFFTFRSLVESQCDVVIDHASRLKELSWDSADVWDAAVQTAIERGREK